MSDKCDICKKTMDKDFNYNKNFINICSAYCYSAYMSNIEDNIVPVPCNLNLKTKIVLSLIILVKQIKLTFNKLLEIFSL